MYYNNTRPKRNGKEKIKNANVAHLVERHLAKVEVASSSLVVRSRVYPVRRTSHCEVRLLFFFCILVNGGGFCLHKKRRAARSG